MGVGAAVASEDDAEAEGIDIGMPLGRFRMFLSGTSKGGAWSLNTFRPPLSSHCHCADAVKGRAIAKVHSRLNKVVRNKGVCNKDVRNEGVSKGDVVERVSIIIRV